MPNDPEQTPNQPAVPATPAPATPTQAQHPFLQKMMDALTLERPDLETGELSRIATMPDEQFNQWKLQENDPVLRAIGAAVNTVARFIPGEAEMTQAQTAIQKTKLGQQMGHEIGEQFKHPEQVAMTGGEEMFPVEIFPEKALAEEAATVPMEGRRRDISGFQFPGGVVVDRRATGEGFGRGTGSFANSVNAGFEGARLADRLKAEAGQQTYLSHAANEYNLSKGRPRINPALVEPDPRASEIADAYKRGVHAPNDPEVKASYDALKHDIDEQYDLANSLGIKMETADENPYGLSTTKPAHEELHDDVLNHKHLAVWKGGAPPADHPLSEVDPKTGLTYNEKFRMVHDIFGHSAERTDFTPKGEESAWNLHRQMFSPEARPALATETRGQAAYTYKYGDFPPQKAMLLPEPYQVRPEDLEPDAPKVSEGAATGTGALVLDALARKFRIGDPSEAMRTEPSFIAPNGQVIYLGQTWHPSAIASVPEALEYHGSEDNRLNFLNDANAIRVRPNMDAREGETFTLSVPKGGVTPAQIPTLERMMGFGHYANLRIETADKPYHMVSNLDHPKDWQFKGPADVRPLLAKMKLLPKSEVDFSTIGGMHLGNATGGPYSGLGPLSKKALNEGRMELSEAKKLSDYWTPRGGQVSYGPSKGKAGYVDVTLRLPKNTGNLFRTAIGPDEINPEQIKGAVKGAAKQTWTQTAADAMKDVVAGAIDPATGKVVDEKGQGKIGLEIYPEARANRAPLDHPPTAQDIKQFYDENRSAFQRSPDLRLGWYQTTTADGKPAWELNVGISSKNKDAANWVARRLDQRSTWDTDAETEIPTGGTGQKTRFPGYPLSERLANIQENFKVPGSSTSLIENPLQVKEAGNLPLSGNAPEHRGVMIKPTGQEGEPVITDFQNAIQRWIDKDQKYDPSIASALKVATDEVRHQLLAEGGEGKGWYRKLTNDAIDKMKEIHPELSDPTKDSIFKGLWVGTSYGNDPLQNMDTAERIYDQYLQTGKFPLYAKTSESGAVEKNWPGKGAGQRGTLTKLQTLIDRYGEKGAIDWLTTKHSNREIHDEFKDIVSVSGLPKTNDEPSYGAMAFGPKGGAFFLNLHGINDHTTVDVWATRALRRWMGTLKDNWKPDVEGGTSASGGPDKAPSQEEINQFHQISTNVAKQLNLDPDDIQALLWYYEHKLYKVHGVGDDALNYAEAAQQIVNNRTGSQINEQAERAEQERKSRNEKELADFVARKTGEKGGSLGGGRQAPLFGNVSSGPSEGSGAAK